MEDFLKKNKRKIFLFSFAAIILCGIFLRTYNFEEWLRFNADQSRDAKVVWRYLEGKTDLPLWGPLAGGTDFKLGPIFYYFQIFSAKIFGNSPDKMAYPDLFFSILAIPLFFFFVRKYFSIKISIALMGIFSVSLFVVQYSRFAWNPNSIPFFVLLFLHSLLKMSEEKGKKKIVWAIVAGIALGVGIQLHTMLLAAMPLTAVLFLAWLFKKKKKLLKEFAVIFLIGLALNAPQLWGDYKNDWTNLLAFSEGASQKTGSQESISEKIAEDFLCQAQSGFYIISSIGSRDECGTSLITKEFKKNKKTGDKLAIILESFFLLSFLIGGLFFWAKYAWKEKDEKKKNFLILSGTYFLTAFLFLIPVANEISTRFYLIMEFVPFLILAFWAKAIMEWAKENRKKIASIIVVASFIFLAGFNIISVRNFFVSISPKDEIEDLDVFITLSETKSMADYIISHTDPSKIVYLEGRQKFLFKYLGSIEYFSEKKGIKIKPFSEKEELPENAIVFIIDNAKKKGELKKSLRETHIAKDVAICGRFSIAVFEKKF